ncbi:MAG: cell wall-binding repeat-containing protein [Actinomycetota bacterium]|nr:cell wall-binding repeat-containing protein [Actinomycetota bacterium]
MPRPTLLTLVVLVAALALAACGRDDRPSAPQRPALATSGDEPRAATDLGFPSFATKNTTRIGGSDATAIAAAVARAVYPDPSRRPDAVALVDRNDWRSALAASALMARPIGAPILFTDGAKLPGASRAALGALNPTGSDAAGDAKVIRVGAVARPKGRKSTDLTGINPFARARAIAAMLTGAQRRPPNRVLIVSADDPSFAAPAAGYAAKTGDPVLFVTKNRLPDETRAALAALQQPKIYVIGPKRIVSDRVTRRLGRLGRVRRTGGRDPIRNAIAFARFRDEDFGWGITDPGHGLVFARSGHPLDAAAAAPLSGTGTFGPLLLLGVADKLPLKLQQYLLDIQPGFQEDPVRGVYNHGWIIGDASTISTGVQGSIDALLEIVSVRSPDAPTP